MIAARPCLPLLLALCCLSPMGCEARPAQGAGASEPGSGADTANQLLPVFDTLDLERPRLAIALTPLFSGPPHPTDLQFVPGEPQLLVVLGKEGQARWFDLSDARTGELLKLTVLTRSEQGLLGLAFHPRFQSNGLFYLNYSRTTAGKAVNRIAEWSVPPGSDLRSASPQEKRTLMEVVQPYANHDAGQLAFGPDGLLYIGFGDGGHRADPLNHGQNANTKLGSMQRLNVDRADATPETFATGLRNPWRYCFGPAGRLIVADVGQDQWEEISIVGRGENHGWKLREGRHCFPPGSSCSSEGLVDPIYEYGRQDGGSVTGGFVVGADTVPGLKGRYVFADFMSGRFWALDLPQPHQVNGPLAKVYALGRFRLAISSFALDAKGHLYAADFGKGTIFRVDSPAGRP